MSELKVIQEKQEGVTQRQAFTINREMYDHYNPERLIFKAKPGINEELVRQISKDKNEPEWMLQKRLTGFRIFNEKPVPAWGPDLSNLDLSQIIYYMKSDAKKNTSSLEEVPEDIRRTYEKLGIPKAEREYLGGSGFQYDSEVVYHNLKKDLENKGVIFLDMDEAVQKNPELVKKYFMTTCVPIGLHKFAALHAAVWSGGCLTGDTEIFTLNPGIKKISDIGPGDYVYAINKENQLVKSKVLGEIYNGKKETFRIRVGGRTLNSTENHKFLCLEKSDKRLNHKGKLWSKKWKELKDINIGDFIAITKKIPDNGVSRELPKLKSYVKNKRHESNLTTPKNTDENLMWILGLYLGDGNIYFPTEHNCYTNIAVPINSDIRKETVNTIKKLFNYDIKTSNENSITINSKALGYWLSELGFSGKAKEKRIPRWIFGLPFSERMSFLGGLLDSDGFVEVNSNSIRFELANKKLIEDIKLLAFSCGLYSDGKILFRKRNPSYSKKLDRTIKGGEFYSCRISGNIKDIKSRSLNKIKKLQQIKKFTFDKYNASSGENFISMTNEYIGFAPLKERESIGINDVYDIQVEGEHNFIANGIIAHNSFIHVPKNIKVEVPLQAYFRMNAKRGGQFEHTLIIVDEGAEVHYIEGCSAPQYTENSLHAGCVEIHVLKNARARYTSIENWSKNTYNLNTKRAIVHENAVMEWLNGNNGCLTGDSKVFTNPEGPIEIQSLESGDKVYVWDEKTNSIKKSVVKYKIFSGYKKVYKLEAGGREIEASANHPFLALVRKKNKEHHKKGFFHYEWKLLEQLRIGDIIGITKKIPIEGKPFKLPEIKIGNEIESKNQYSSFKMNTTHLYNEEITYPNETNDDFMWLMGLILGDGHIDLKYNKINIATHLKEDFREELISLLKNLFKYEVTEKKERYIVINSKVLCQLFSGIGFNGNADTKKVPSWVFAIPEKQILSFLAGYLDSDGHVGKGVYFTSINKNILEQVKLLGIQTGFGVSRIFKHGRAREMEILGRKYNLKDSWRILFNGQKVKSLPIKSKIKKEKINNIITRRKNVSSKGLNFKSKTNEEIGFVRVNNISEVGIKPTFDIEVENYHNFISNGLVVHNSKVTMLYPCSILIGKNAKSDYLGIAYAGSGQYQDTGCKVYHLAENTSSSVLSKGISMDGGITSYRGLVNIKKGAINSKSNVRCDGLMLDNKSKALTFPSMDVHENDVKVAHEAAVGKIEEDQLFYLMSRGLSEDEAIKMIVSGFIEPIVKALPMEYAVELNRLIELEIENSVC